MLLRVIAASRWPPFGPQVRRRRARRTRPADDGEKTVRACFSVRAVSLTLTRTKDAF